MITEELWNDLSTSEQPVENGLVSRRVYPKSTNDIHAALLYPSRQRSLIISAEVKAFKTASPVLQNLRDARGISLKVAPLSRDVSRLSITLTSQELATVFTALAEDIARLASAASPEQVISSAAKRYSRWQDLLTAVGSQGIPTHTRRGLFGELHTLERLLLDEGVPPLDAIRAWTGPHGTDQDFQLPRCALEVKTHASITGHVTIANERQLHAPFSDGLYLIVHQVDERRGGSGTSLSQYISEIREKLQGGPAASAFDVNLAHYGYIHADSHKYEEPRYTVRSTTAWYVDEEFPRITPADIPADISQCQYQLETGRLKEFEVEHSELTKHITTSETA